MVVSSLQLSELSRPPALPNPGLGLKSQPSSIETRVILNPPFSTNDPAGCTEAPPGSPGSEPWRAGPLHLDPQGPDHGPPDRATWIPRVQTVVCRTTSPGSPGPGPWSAGLLHLDPQGPDRGPPDHFTWIPRARTVVCRSASPGSPGPGPWSAGALHLDPQGPNHGPPDHFTWIPRARTVVRRTTSPGSPGSGPWSAGPHHLDPQGPNRGLPDHFTWIPRARTVVRRTTSPGSPGPGPWSAGALGPLICDVPFSHNGAIAIVMGLKQRASQRRPQSLWRAQNDEDLSRMDTRLTGKICKRGTRSSAQGN